MNDAKNTLFYERRQMLIRFNEKHGYPPDMDTISKLWNITRSGVEAYIKRNKLTSYITINISTDIINQHNPEIITSQIKQLQKEYGIVFISDLIKHKIIYDRVAVQLTDEQQAMITHKQTYRSATLTNNNIKLLQAFHSIYGRKPNTNDVVQMLNLKSSRTLYLLNNRHHNVYQKYYTQLKRNETYPPKLTDKQLSEIYHTAQLNEWYK